MPKILLRVAALALLTLAPCPGSAEPGKLHPRPGPLTAILGDNLATIKVPAGFQLFDKADAHALIEAGGSSSNDEVGAITESRESDFAVLLRYQPIGHVKDDDAAKLDPEGMLKDFKEGTEQANEERKRNGIPPLHVTRWTQVPTYDARRHLITYGLEGTSEGKPFLNCDTQLLGRNGILTFKLMTEVDTLERNTAKADALLAGLSFKAGERYADFDPSHDKESGIGLRELVLGGAGIAVASKLGLLAKFSKLLLWALVALKKVGVLVVAAVVSGFRKLTGKKEDPGRDA